MKKEYLLFAGHRYYPRGGMKDLCFRGTQDECKKYFLLHAGDIAHESYIDNWGQIVDMSTLEIIAYGALDHALGTITEAGVPRWVKNAQELDICRMSENESVSIGAIWKLS